MDKKKLIEYTEWVLMYSGSKSTVTKGFIKEMAKTFLKKNPGFFDDTDPDSFNELNPSDSTGAENIFGLDFSAKEIVFNEDILGFHLDLSVPIMDIGEVFVSQLMISKYSDVLKHAKSLVCQFYRYDSGRFKNKWYVSYRLKPDACNKLLEEYPTTVRDGNVNVIKL